MGELDRRRVKLMMRVMARFIRPAGLNRDDRGKAYRCVIDFTTARPSHRGQLNGVCGTSTIAGSPKAAMTGAADMAETAKKDSVGEEDWPHCRKIKTVGLAITH